MANDPPNLTPLPFDAMRNQISSVHSEVPQRQGLAMLAMDSLQRALQELAALGHNIVLGWAGTPAPQPYPRMLYKGMPPEVVEQFGVENKSEEVAMVADGWRVEQQAAAPAPKAPEPSKAEPIPVVTAAEATPKAPEAAPKAT